MKMKIFIGIVVVAIVGLLLFPKGQAEMTEKNIKTGYVLTQDKKKIYYDHYISGHQKVVVLLHGFYNSRKAVLFKDMAHALEDHYDVVVMDMRGHGDSDGPFYWTAHSHQDLKAVVKYVRDDYERVGVVGFSLGAVSSLVATSRTKDIDSLIVVSPGTSFGAVNFHFWKMGIMENIVYNVFQEGRIGKGVHPGHLWKKKIKPIDIVDKIATPTFFIHGKKDWLILPKHSQELFAKAKMKKRLKIVENGTHAEYIFRRDREGTIKLFKGWFKETL